MMHALRTRPTPGLSPLLRVQDAQAQMGPTHVQPVPCVPIAPAWLGATVAAKLRWEHERGQAAHARLVLHAQRAPHVARQLRIIGCRAQSISLDE